MEPVSDRLKYINLRGTIPTTMIIAYMPQSDRPYDPKTEAYGTQQSSMDRKKTKDHFTYQETGVPD